MLKKEFNIKKTFLDNNNRVCAYENYSKDFCLKMVTDTFNVVVEQYEKVLKNRMIKSFENNKWI